MKVKKIILIVIAIAIVLGIGTAFAIGGKKNKSNAKYKIVASNFASFDFLRAIIGEKDKDVELTFLIGPGKDAHSYDPTAGDLIKIQDSDLFVYVGGEMEKWSEKVLNSLDTKKTEIICISDFVETMEEKEVDGAEEHEHEGEEHHEEEAHEEHEHEHEEGAFDEHIWTSPENAIKMVNALEKSMEKIDSENSKIYKENADKYIAQIKDVDSKIQNIVDNKVRKRLIFAEGSTSVLQPSNAAVTSNL